MAKMDKPLGRKLIQRQPKPKSREYASATASTNRHEIERDLAKLEGTYCPTATDKYHILLKRDALLSKLRTKSTDVNEARNLTANCPDMCPEKERYCRSVGNLLHAYECNPDGRLNPSLAVKDYSRSAADQEEPLPHELRPPNVLQKTMDYLILKIDKSMPRSELTRWYDFTWSRTRAIRKEITQQMIVDKTTVSLVEKCARFHIYASFCMANLEVKDFDEQMNTENLSKCLQTLRHMYDDLARKSVFCESECEFRSYDILVNLADSNVLSMTHTYRKEVRDAPIFKLAMRLTCSFQTDNYVTFFRLIRQKATFLQACLCRSHFGQIRSTALHSLVKSARPPKVSLSKFTEILAFNNNDDTETFMKALEMHVESDGMVRYGSDYLLFSEVSDGKTNYGCRFIEEKIHEPLPTIIAGGPCAVPEFSKPVDSFVSDYYGKIPTNPTPMQKLTSLSQSSSLTSTQTNSIKSTLSSMSGGNFQQKPPSVPSPNQPNSVSASFTFKLAQKPQSSFNPSPVPQFPSVMNNSQPSVSGLGVPTLSKFPNGFADQAQKSTTPQFPSFFNNTQQPKTSNLNAPTIPQFPSPFNNTDPPVPNSFNASTTPQFPSSFNDAQAKILPEIPEEPTIKLPSGFGQQAKSRLTDDILNFCVDDFIWLAAHELRRLEKERLLEARQEIIKKREQQLPKIGREIKSKLFDDIIGFCIDDLIWSAAKEAHDQGQKIEKMLHKHNMRIAKPYGKKWLEAARLRIFCDSLPEISFSESRKRPSIAFDQDGPDAKRSKKFTPLRFSTKF